MKIMIDDIYEKMPWAELDTIVFDVGQVLLSFEPEKVMENEFPGQKELHEKLMTRMFKSPYWIMMDRGIISTEEAISAMAGRDKALAVPVRHIIDKWIDSKTPISEGVDALHACKAHGKKLYILSNYGDATFSLACQKFDFFKLFDGMVVSSRVKMVKPGLDIFDYTARKFELNPERTLFIDDTPANIEAALYAGWQGFCMNEKGKLSSFIEE